MGGGDFVVFLGGEEGGGDRASVWRVGSDSTVCQLVEVTG